METSTETEPAVKVKTELLDEPEIMEMAERLKESNKVKMLAVNAAAARALPVPNPQLGILNYLTRKTPAEPAQPVQPAPADTTKNVTPMDDATIKGHFGWETVGKCFVPYIFRYGEKWVCVRMAETKLLSKHLASLHPELYSCTYIRSFFVSDMEARLLNEINIRHCDSLYGREPFTVRDLIVRLSEAIQFYNFLEMCYNRMIRGISTKDKCGFIRINKESVVPYTVRDGQRYVPLFYFEGETDNLKQKSNPMKGWDLVYLKFCCKVQGIRNELFASETCYVISLADIKSYFPAGTQFEEYWPNKMADTHLLINTKNKSASSSGDWDGLLQNLLYSGQNPAAGGQWTRAPSAPPVIHNNHHHLNSNNNNNNNNSIHNSVNGTMSTPPRSRRAAVSGVGGHGNAAHSTARGQAAAISATVQALTGWPLPQQLTQQQTQQVLRIAQAQAQAQAQAHVVARYNLGMSQHRTQQQQQQRSLQQQYANGSHGLSISQAQAQAQAQAQPQQQQPPALVRNNASTMNGHSDNDGSKRVAHVPDVPANINPYKIQKALVEKMMIPCINSKPYMYQELLMTLPDLATHFFPRVSLADVRAMVDALGITLYRPNTNQLTVLRAAGKCKSCPNAVARDNESALVHVRDVMTHMPQFVYMQHAHSSAHTPPPAHSHHNMPLPAHTHSMPHHNQMPQHATHSQHGAPPNKRTRAN